MAAQVCTDFFADLFAPELIEISATTVGKLKAHLQPIGLHQIERAQQTIEAGQYTQMLLGVVLRQNE